MVLSGDKQGGSQRSHKQRRRNQAVSDCVLLWPQHTAPPAICQEALRNHLLGTEAELTLVETKECHLQVQWTRRHVIWFSPTEITDE